MSLDRIYIRDLMVRCIIGIYPEERRDKQDILINVELAGDFAAAARSDDIADAVDYKAIKKRIVSLVEKSSFNLIETLAEHIARVALEHPKVAEVKVTVDKPGALRFARSVAYEITRRKSGNAAP